MLKNVLLLEDYKLIKEHADLLKSDLVVEAARLSDDWDKSMKFGCIMATHRIEKGIKARKNTTPKVLKAALDSIFAQTHDNFKVYLVADYYPEEHLDEIQKIIDSYPKEKIWFHNLPKSCVRDTPASKKKWPGDKRYGISSFTHACGGWLCWNTALKQAKSDGIKFIAKLDHDDKWTKDHLETVAKGFTQFPDTVYMATRATKRKMTERQKGDGKDLMYIPPNESVKDIDYDNIKMDHLKPFSGSAIAWKLDKLYSCKFRDYEGQCTTAPKRSEVLHADSDFYKSVADTLKEKGWKLLYIPKVTNPIRNSDGKF